MWNVDIHFLVHINRCDELRLFSHFFEGRGFYHGEVIVQKFGLDKEKACPCGEVACRRQVGGVYCAEAATANIPLPVCVPGSSVQGAPLAALKGRRLGAERKFF